MKKRVLTAVLLCSVMLFGAMGGLAFAQLQGGIETTGGSPAESGFITAFQTNQPYREGIAIPTDAVMVSEAGINQTTAMIGSWKNKGYEKVYYFAALGRDGETRGYLNEIYDGDIPAGQKAADIAQLTSGGAVNKNYALPSPAFTEYLKDGAFRAFNAGADGVVFEEPDAFLTGRDNNWFKQKWVAHYGSAYEDYTSKSGGERNYYQLLRAKLYSAIFAEALTTLSAAIKTEYPDKEVYIAVHSTFNYFHHTIATNYAGLLSLSTVDGIVGQSWSDTIIVPSYFDSGTSKQQNETALAYMEYSEFVNSARILGKKVITLVDPKSDDPGISWANCQTYYRYGAAAQFLRPDVTAFEVLPWPGRAFEAFSDTGYPVNFRGVQEAYFNVTKLTEQTSEVTLSAGTGGIAVGTSWTNAIYSAETTARKQTYALGMPLIYEGIPAEMIPIELLSVEGSLDGIHTLVLSYDHIKPLSAAINNAIAVWVKAGGTLVYVGEAGADSLNGNLYFEGQSGSVSGDLFTRLGITVTTSTNLQTFSVDGGRVYVSRNAIANITSSGTNRNNYVENVVGAAVTAGGKTWSKPGRIITTRELSGGNAIVSVGAFREDVVLENEFAGTYLDLMNNLAVRVNPTITKSNQAALLYRLKSGVQQTKVGFINSVRADITRDDKGLYISAMYVPNSVSEAVIHTGGKALRIYAVDGNNASITFTQETVGTNLIKLKANLDFKGIVTYKIYWEV